MKPRNFKRIWGKPWDWYYLLDLERHKIREMMNYINKTQRFVGWEIVVRDMRTCIKLIDIVLEEDIPYKSWLHQSYGHPVKDFELLEEVKFPKYINIRNRHRFLHKDFLNGNNPNIFNSLLAEYRKIKALTLYNKIRTYKLFSWWD
jgi:hypothetical protein